MQLDDFFAIDIGKKNIKLVHLKKSGHNTAQLLNIGQVPFPDNITGTIPSDKEPEKVQLLASVIRSLVQSQGLKTKQVVSVLPESAVFSKLLTVPLVEEAKLEETIYWEAKQSIPFPIEEAQTEWLKGRETKTSDGRTMMDVMFMGAPRVLVENYLKLFDAAELELIALEVESVALARMLAFNYPESANALVMLIDIGGEGTDVSIIANSKLIYSQSINVGSTMFTKAIASDFNLQPAQADQYKYTYGMRTDQPDQGKIFNSVRPIVDVIVNEINKILGFTSTRLNYGGPSQIYLTGNGALMPGIGEYFQNNFKINVLVADPLKNVNLPDKLANLKNEGAVQGYAVATGLALKDE